MRDGIPKRQGAPARKGVASARRRDPAQDQERLNRSSESQAQTAILPFHEAADIFPLMDGHELSELVRDIKNRGLHSPIITFEGKVIEGRNREIACHQAGVEPRHTSFQGKAEDVVPFIISANIYRRHLTPAQRRDLLTKLLKLQPEASNRAIAKQAKVSHHTVASVRAETEANGQIAHKDERVEITGRKARGRKPGKVLPKESEVVEYEAVPEGASTVSPETTKPAEALPPKLNVTAAVSGCIRNVENLLRDAISTMDAGEIMGVRDGLRKVIGKILRGALANAMLEETSAQTPAGDGLDIPDYLKVENRKQFG
jgi:hypothetical protein